MDISGRPLYGTAVDEPLFVDRTDAFERITRAVKARLSLLVVGPRGSGRTSLLYHCARRLRADGIAAIVVAADPEAPALDVARQVRRLLGAEPRSASASLTAMFQMFPTPPNEDLLGVLGDLRATDAASLPSEPMAIDPTNPPVVMLDGVRPDVVHTLFGRARDEMWRVAVTWIVVVDEDDEAAALQPPADAFFALTVHLGPLDEPAARELLRLRVDASELPDAALDAIVADAHGNPRALVRLAQRAVVEGVTTAAGTDRSDEERRLHEVSAGARTLYRHLIQEGSASASDTALLRRLGWSRSRTAQLFAELEGAGLVRSSEVHTGRGGRPRRVFAPSPEVVSGRSMR